MVSVKLSIIVFRAEQYTINSNEQLGQNCAKLKWWKCLKHLTLPQKTLYYILESILRHTDHLFWMLIPVLVSIVLITYVRVVRMRNLVAVFEGFLDLRAFKRLIREESLYSGWASNILMLNSWLLISLFIAYAIERFIPLNANLSIEKVWLWLLGGLFFYYWTKRIILYIVGSMSDISLVVFEFLTYNKFYIKFVGLLILPLFVLLNFLSYELTNPIFNWVHELLPYLMLVVIAGSYLTKVYQGYQQCVEIKISGYYLFLYFCTLEILPLIGVFFWLIGNNSLLN